MKMITPEDETFVRLKYNISNDIEVLIRNGNFPTIVYEKWAWRCADFVEGFFSEFNEECMRRINKSIRLAKLYRDNQCSVNDLMDAWNLTPVDAVDTPSYFAARKKFVKSLVRSHQCFEDRNKDLKPMIQCLIEVLIEYENEQ